MPSGLRTLADDATPSPSIRIAPRSSAIATASFTPAPSAGLRIRLRFSLIASPITFAPRLTHTIEVTQISRTVASRLNLNADLVEALALVHDIGHPPFGHAGEIALDAVMQRHGVRFDHNLHALRIVESFEKRYVDFAGLNLTFEVREGIIKHSRDYDANEHPELAEYLLDLRPPLEAQLIDLADEIAYNTAIFLTYFVWHICWLPGMERGNMDGPAGACVCRQ